MPEKIPPHEENGNPELEKKRDELLKQISSFRKVLGSMYLDEKSVSAKLDVLAGLFQEAQTIESIESYGETLKEFRDFFALEERRHDVFTRLIALRHEATVTRFNQKNVSKEIDDMHGYVQEERTLEGIANLEIRIGELEESVRLNKK